VTKTVCKTFCIGRIKTFSVWNFVLRGIQAGLKANLNAGRNDEEKEQCIQNAENVARPDANDVIWRAAQPPKSNRLIWPRLRFLQFVQTPNGRMNFLPDRRNFARLALRALSNGRPRCPVPLNVLNQTVKAFFQCRDLFSSSDLSFSCRPRPSPTDSEAAFATSALIRGKSTMQSITERKFEGQQKN
jgi:hypothetical protein